MIMAGNINEAAKTGRVLKGRRPDMAEGDFDGVFATVSQTDKSGVFVGSFDGESAWERHPGGDELVQVVAGKTRLTILSDAGEDVVLEMGAGMATIVPQGLWHRFYAPDGVTVMTMTPTVPPTDHDAGARPSEG